ncbi:MAG: hypothetical protein OXC46_08400 [Thaumarchaeota archaeon]|nr:hypothetical protein [Nitrososphaerota archaeon]
MEEIIKLLMQNGYTEADSKAMYNNHINWLKKAIVPIYSSSNFRAAVESNRDQLVILKDVKVVLLRTDNLLPQSVKVNIGYVPNGKTLHPKDLSGVATDLSGPIEQGVYTDKLANAIRDNLDAVWAMVVAESIPIAGSDIEVITSSVSDNEFGKSDYRLYEDEMLKAIK